MKNVNVKKATKTLMALLAVTAMLGLSGCTSQSDAERALKSTGHTDIQMTGYNFLACSEDDFYHTGFSAENREGRIVTGTVCSGLIFKSATVRY